MSQRSREERIAALKAARVSVTAAAGITGLADLSESRVAARMRACADCADHLGEANVSYCQACESCGGKPRMISFTSPDSPKAFRCPAERWALRVAWVIPALNEHREVAATCQSLIASAAGAAIALTVIVVDDGSSDGCCAALPEEVIVIRNERSLGTTVSMNRGLLLALRGNAQVVGFSDAHMRFSRGLATELAFKAHESGAICAAAARHMDAPEQMAWGGRWTWSHEGLLTSPFNSSPPTEAWGRVATVLGACWCLGRAAVETLSKPTGTLFDGDVEPWGYTEEALGIKAALLGIETLCSRDFAAEHLYRRGDLAKRPSNAGLVPTQQAYVLARYFTPIVFLEHFRSDVEKRVGESKAIDLFGRAQVGISRPWSIETQGAFAVSIMEGAR